MSDQDFFFDDEDEDEKPAKQAKDKKTTSAPAKQKSQPTSKTAGASFWQQTVTTSVAGLVALIFMLLGVIVGIVLPVGGVTSDVPSPTVTGTDAPPLSQEQLSSGEMPEGHPPLDSMMGDPAVTDTSAVEATSTP